MYNWNQIENLGEPGLPLLAYLLKGTDAEKMLPDQYESESAEYTKMLHRELCEGLTKLENTGRYIQLRSMCGEIGAYVLDCAMSCVLYPHLEARLNDCCEGGCSFSVCGPLQLDETYLEMRRQYQMVSKLLPISNPEENMFFRTGFYVDRRIMDYLAGADELPQELERFACLWNPQDKLQSMYVDEEQIPEVEKLLLNGHPLQMVGDSGRGRKTLLRHTLAGMHKWGICVDADILCKENGIQTILWKLRREALLLDAVVCIYGINEEWYRKYGQAYMLLFKQYFNDVGLCVCTDQAMNLASGLIGDWNRIEMRLLKQKDCIALWDGYCRQFGIRHDPRLLGSKYRMSPDQIAKAARRIGEHPNPDSKVMMNSCIDVLPAVGKNIKQMQVTYTFDDLKVSPQTKMVLESICAHVNYREKVYGQWGLESRYSYGRSVSALFSGPPGTGKTMAAHVLSSTLGIPLYSINLAQVVDKYIGETEKKLEEVFSLAERSNTILFFDEADSMFGKRSEVNDSKDRYANIEVSYILQRMEQYDGIVILATNNRNNIDDAFMRRIRYAASFPLPDVGLRKEIWMSCFDKATPVGDVDFDFLARTFEYSGGDIKNIVLNSVFLAAQEGSEEIDMTHILKSIRMEYVKNNKILLKEDLREYRDLIF